MDCLLLAKLRVASCPFWSFFDVEEVVTSAGVRQFSSLATSPSSLFSYLGQTRLYAVFGRRKMNAVFAESGKQFYVQAGDTVRLDFREANPGDTVEFDRVLLVTDGNGGVAVGRPYVPGAKVVAKVVGDVRGKKIHVGFYKRRKNFRKHKGHRQTYTEVKVDSITY